MSLLLRPAALKKAVCSDKGQPPRMRAQPPWGRHTHVLTHAQREPLPTDCMSWFRNLGGQCLAIEKAVAGPQPLTCVLQNPLEGWAQQHANNSDRALMSVL